MIGQFLKV